MAAQDEVSAEVASLREEAARLKSEAETLRAINRTLHQQRVAEILRIGSVQAVTSRPESSSLMVHFGKKRKGASECGAPAAKVQSAAPVDGDAPDSCDDEEISEQDPAESAAQEPQASTSAEANPRRPGPKNRKKKKEQEAPQNNKPKTARSLLKKNKKKGRRR